MLKTFPIPEIACFAIPITMFAVFGVVSMEITKNYLANSPPIKKHIEYRTQKVFNKKSQYRLGVLDEIHSR